MFAKFTREMKETHTILIPTMIEPHFTFMAQVIRAEGYKCEVLSPELENIGEEGLKYVHNDMCYPALLVIGQFIKAIKSGAYDTDKVALLITQTGGGCRASNYITLLRKALENSGLEHIPVISLNFGSLDENAFSLSKKSLIRLFYAIYYGDLIMTLYNQCISYERTSGATQDAYDECVRYVCERVGKWSFYRLSHNVKFALSKFGAISRDSQPKVRVGIVGEIYLKYSPLGNGFLSQYLVSKGAEVVNTGLLDFILMCIYDEVFDTKIYGIKSKTAKWARLIALAVQNRQERIISLIRRHGKFRAPTPFGEVIGMADGIISHGVKMGEGWLLTAEMAEFARTGVKNILCVQPFGCLPNHIIARGMIRKVKEKYQDVNIISIDYDISASRVNQENRINLMLQTARA